MNIEAIKKAEQQIIEERKTVDYDIKEFTIELILNKYENNQEEDQNEIYIPSYQRQYVWDQKRASKFIESILLGLPIPYLFVAETEEGRLEVIDGSQRIRTLSLFKNNQLKLIDLKKLTLLENFIFDDLPTARQRKFNNSTLRMITLTENSDEDARFLMFERINTGSVNLEQMQKRKGLHGGEFTKYLYEKAKDPCYKNLTHFSELEEKRDEPVELLLRFFAYTEKYNIFSGVVNEFLTEFLKEKNKNGFDRQTYDKKLYTMLNFVADYMPYAFKVGSGSKKTPRIRFEAISVGTHLALAKCPTLKPSSFDWLDSEQFKSHTSGWAKNSRKKLIERVEYVRDQLLRACQ